MCGGKERSCVRILKMTWVKAPYQTRYLLSFHHHLSTMYIATITIDI
jgi:hypothetical protein